jgi:nucleotide-binding universal stress UspA family protein
VEAVPSGPVLIAYDGSDAADDAIRQAGSLVGGRSALVVVVWKAGLGFELLELPASTIGLPPAAIDIRTALEIDAAMSERAQRMARVGAGLAREVGFEPAEGLAVAEDLEIPVSETIVRVARERDAQAIVLGAHGHGRLGEVLLGSTSRDVIRHAPCPVVVARPVKPDAATAAPSRSRTREVAGP